MAEQTLAALQPEALAVSLPAATEVEQRRGSGRTLRGTKGQRPTRLLDATFAAPRAGLKGRPNPCPTARHFRHLPRGGSDVLPEAPGVSAFTSSLALQPAPAHVGQMSEPGFEKSRWACPESLRAR